MAGEKRGEEKLWGAIVLLNGENANDFFADRSDSVDLAALDDDVNIAWLICAPGKRDGNGVNCAPALAGAVKKCSLIGGKLRLGSQVL